MSLPGLAPIVSLLVLLELSAGTFTLAFLGDLLGEVGRGFLGTTAAICGLILAIALMIAAILPDPSLLMHHPVAAGAVDAIVHWSVAFLVGLILYAFLCAVGTDPARRVAGGAALGSAVMVLARSAEAFGGSLGSARAAFLAFAPAALLSGAALAGMLLGHWYLISPDLSFRPLRRAVYAVFVALAIQAATVVVAVATASAHPRSDVLGSRYGPFFWLLVVGAGLVFTAAVNGLTLYFARIRSNQPATAMLYVLIISVLMGIVPAHLLYFMSRVPV